MQFATQREVLEYLGKNPDDRNLIQRLRKRWELYKEDWMYVLVTDKDTLIEENKELKLKVKELRVYCDTLDSENHNLSIEVEELRKGEGKNLKEELEEAKIQWEYWERMYDEEVVDKQNRIRKCFLWIKQKEKWADWEEFRDWVMSDEE